MFDNIPVDKIGLKDTRLSNLEYLGGDMIEAGNEFGAGTPYGERASTVHTQLRTPPHSRLKRTSDKILHFFKKSYQNIC